MAGFPMLQSIYMFIFLLLLHFKVFFIIIIILYIYYYYVHIHVIHTNLLANVLNSMKPIGVFEAPPGCLALY